MNDAVQPATVEAVQFLYENNQNARRLFDWAASLQRDATATTIDRFSDVLGISRKAAVTLAQELETAGCGEFIVGRRGSPSRLEWKYSRVSLGRVAFGEAAEIEAVSDPISESEEEALNSENAAQPLTIQSAKISLAKALGVEPAQVEITIRA